MTQSHIDLTALLAEAVDASPLDRVPLYRDRLAAAGSAVVVPVLGLVVDRPQLGFFGVTVLEAAARRGARDAWTAIEHIAATSEDGDLRAFARQKLGSHNKSAGEQQAWILGVVPDEPEPSTPTDIINAAKRSRGEPLLDEAELQQVLGNLRRREADPRRYRSVCWYCHAVVDASTNVSCDECGWLVCWCGACREPERPWPGGVGPCPIEAGLFGEELNYPTHDFRGRSITSANRPAVDSADIEALLRARGVTSVFHWSPGRGCESILRRGLLSRRELRHAGVQFVAHGYGSRDKEAALDGHVGLTFRTKPEMMHAWSKSPVVFEIAPFVLIDSGVLFVPGNSAASTFSADALGALTGAAAFQAMWADERSTPVSQAEAWVPRRVPSTAIVGLHVASDEVARLLSTYLARRGIQPTRVEISVSPELFSMSPEHVLSPSRP